MHGSQTYLLAEEGRFRCTSPLALPPYINPEPAGQARAAWADRPAGRAWLADATAHNFLPIP